MPQSSKPFRILYAAGPGNVLGTYQYWINQQDDPSQISVTYSSQFYDVCRSLNAEGYIISSFPQKNVVKDEEFIIEHRPKQFNNAPGMFYHLAQIWYGLRLVFTALRWRADVLVAADGTTHWFVLALLPLLGIAVVPSLHCVVWRKYLPQKKTEKLFARLSRQLFTRCASILAVSKDVAAQVRIITGDDQTPSIREFRPFYRKGGFDDIQPSVLQHPFRVLFIGRMEECKGVFDVLQIAKRFAIEKRQDVQFHFCGLGSALEQVERLAKAEGLEASMQFHGYCNKAELQEQLNQAHIVIVPTKTTFVEGFNKVVAEGILAGRPVVTSAVCPALFYAKPGVVEVAPDQVQEYGDAILKLLDEPEFYAQKQRGCRLSQNQFYDEATSWGSQLRGILVTLQAQRYPQPDLVNQREHTLAEPLKR